MLYDIVFLYQQFLADLPDTFLEFRRKWVQMFPLTYDTKSLSTNCGYFHRTDLGKLYEKCLVDAKMKSSNAKIFMDEENEFVRYKGCKTQKEERL